MHGGKSLAWFAHPNFKHGLYSKYGPRDLAVKMLFQRLRREEAERTLEQIEWEAEAGPWEAATVGQLTDDR